MNSINLNNTRYSNNKLGNRTAFSNTVNNRKYYSSLDADIYIGETCIDEVVSISWTVEQATMPIFGYNSYVFDDIAIGARQITGQFVINFIKSNFMYEVLQNVQEINKQSLQPSVSTDSKLSWSSNYEKEHMPSWNKTFNIRVGYGSSTDSQHNTIIVLYCVQLTGCSQVLDINGAVVGENYSFIAKDIRYELSNVQEQTGTQKTIEVKQVRNDIDIRNVFIENSGVSGASDKYTLNVNFNTENGYEVTNMYLDIVDIKSDSSTEKITSVGLDIGNNSPIKYKIPYKYNNFIDKKIASNESSVQCILTIMGKKDGKQQDTISKNLSVKIQ